MKELKAKMNFELTALFLCICVGIEQDIFFMLCPSVHILFLQSKTKLRFFSLKMFKLVGKGVLRQLHKTPQVLACIGLGSESSIRIDFSNKDGLSEGGGESSRHGLGRLIKWRNNLYT